MTYVMEASYAKCSSEQLSIVSLDINTTTYSLFPPSDTVGKRTQ